MTDKNEKEEMRQNALNKAEEAYQCLISPHYRDNERYLWAINTINHKFNEENGKESRILLRHL